MKTLSLQHQLHYHSQFTLTRRPRKTRPSVSISIFPAASASLKANSTRTSRPIISKSPTSVVDVSIKWCSTSRTLVVGAVTVGMAAAFLLTVGGLDEQHSRALALGPEGPLVEEFWDNVRRYALYALTVSTGAIYTILEPIIDLLKNPITALLILIILGGSFYIMSQVLSAMIGITDFSYDYGY